MNGLAKVMMLGGVEDRFRDRRGREHYDSGRYAPGRSDLSGGTEDAPRGGGYAVWDRYDGGSWPMEPHIPPYYSPAGRRDGVNMIGFDRGAEMRSDYRADAGYHQPEDERGHAREQTRGGGSGEMHLTQEMAQEWTRGMHNEDGTKGAHWTIDQARQLLNQRNLTAYDPYEFWAVMNSIYSDYCAVLKKHGVNNIDAYVDLTCAWLNDKDAVPNKAAAYFTEIVR